MITGIVITAAEKNAENTEVEKEWHFASNPSYVVLPFQYIHEVFLTAAFFGEACGYLQ